MNSLQEPKPKKSLGSALGVGLLKGGLWGALLGFALGLVVLLDAINNDGSHGIGLGGFPIITAVIGFAIGAITGIVVSLFRR